jgi:hypothetical protein
MMGDLTQVQLLPAESGTARRGEPDLTEQEIALIVTEEIEAEKVLVVLYMKNWVVYAVTNYWAADGKLHPDFLRRREHDRSG